MKFNLGKSLLLIVTLAACAEVNIHGQIAGGLTETTNARMGGNNFIVGTIFWPDGSTVNTRLPIRLRTPEYGDILVTTDDRGRFVFSGLGNGMHTLVIDSEPEFEAVREEVDIVRKRSAVPDTYTLSVRLRDKVDYKRRVERPAVIKASNAEVPKQAYSFYEKAAELSRAKDHPAAIAQLRLAVAAYPNFLNAWNEIGVQFLRMGDPAQAEAPLQKALEIKADAFEPLINLGIALFRQGKFDQADAILRQSIKANPGAGVARYYLGRTLNKAAKNDEAEVELLAALKADPAEFKESHRLLAVIYLDRGDRVRVVEQLEAYLKLAPTAVDADELRKVIEQNRAPIDPSTVKK